MGFRYRKTKSVAPGVKVNLNKKSASVRFGGKGVGVTLNTNGKKTQSIGIPDTGLSYTQSSGGGSSNSGNSSRHGCLISVIVVVLVLSIFIAILFSNCKKQSPDFTGMDVFSIPNHPVYGCSVDDAKEFYKDYIDDDIVYFDGNYQKYQEGITLLTLDHTFGSKQSINEIELYFKNTEIGSVDLDTALKITKEYLPISIMKEFYAFERSYLIADFDYDSSNTLANRYMRIVHYARLEPADNSATTQTEKSDYYLPTQIFIVLYSKEDDSKIDYVVIKESLKENYIHPDFSTDKLLDTKWDYDFLAPDGVPITTMEPSTAEFITEPTTLIESITKKQVPASAKSETQKPTEKKNPPAQQSTPRTGTYTLNTKTGKYHYSNCGTLKNANAENLTEISFDQTSNYSPCKKCNPPQA